MAVMTDDERREYHRRSRRRETLIMAVDAVIALIAGVSFIWWTVGGTVPVVGWLVMAVTMAIRNIYAQRTIRLLREANRDVQVLLNGVQQQWQAFMENMPFGR
jgi:hypothetical protein